MASFPGWLPRAAVIALTCAAAARSEQLAAPPPRHEALRAALEELRKADQVTIVESWSGLGPASEKRYVLRRKGTPSKEGAVVPDPVLDRFLDSLASAPVLSGPYKPFWDHTDDYPKLSITMGPREEPVVFFSESQGRDRVPWAIDFAGKRYVVPSDAPARALDLVRGYLEAGLVASESTDPSRPRVVEATPSPRPTPSLPPSPAELDRAIESGNAAQLKRLLERGADVNVTLHGGSTTPLIEAARRGQVEVVRALLSAGADPLATTLLEGDALSAAVRAGSDDALALLIEAARRAGARKGAYRRAVVDAAQAGRAEALRLLLAAGADPDRGDDATGRTPLHIAAATGKAGVVAQLIRAGARPDAPDHRGLPALIEATQNGHAEVVRVLLKHGARSKLQEGLSEACGAGHLEVAKLLIAAGADVNGTAFNGSTPLMSAAGGSKPDVTRMLLDAGARVTPVDGNGRTALFIAAVRGCDVPPPLAAAAQAVVRMLLDAGADPHVRDRDGRTVLDVLALIPPPHRGRAGSAEMVAVIREARRP